MNLKNITAAHREPVAVSILQARLSLAEFTRIVESVERSCDRLEDADDPSEAIADLRNAIDSLWEFHDRLEGKL